MMRTRTTVMLLLANTMVSVLSHRAQAVWINTTTNAQRMPALSAHRRLSGTEHEPELWPVTACTVCAAGSITNTGLAVGATKCTACPAGLYSTASDVAACTVCAAGSITNTGPAVGATTCTACAAGLYSRASNVSACTVCAAGSITNTAPAVGATTCTACAAGLYSTYTVFFAPPLPPAPPPARVYYSAKVLNATTTTAAVQTIRSELKAFLKAPPPPAASPPPPVATVTAQATFPIQIASIAVGSPARISFENDFKTQMAAQIGDGTLYNASHIIIKGIVSGSVDVAWSLSAPPSLAALVADLVHSVQPAAMNITVDGAVVTPAALTPPVVFRTADANCQGAWGTCVRGICQQQFLVTVVQSGTGLACSASHAAIRNCSGGNCACVGSPVPENGAAGTCLDTLPRGSSCQPVCLAGYTLSGESACSSSGSMTVARCIAPPTSAQDTKVTLILNIDIATIPPASPARRAFKTQFRNDVAATLSTDMSAVIIESITAASVRRRQLSA
jgi:hypothetical protein